MITEEAQWTKSEYTTSKTSNLLKPYKEKIRNTIFDAWQEIWDHTSTGLFYQEIQPIVNYTVKYTAKQRAKETLITRFRLGHTRLNNFQLYRMGLRATPDCDICKEDVEHFLLHCPQQDELRQKLTSICKVQNKRPTMKNF